ncbi:hypothetical protein D9611_005003 [Ephemerocybe angulata]|uniref:F-box domain-containing protein n=1 Tax=Ephemerocybe angulata TaxID=980116 RepID=A0A8H5B3F9_9AGAR|nr:hypothetical protein D9611_005003 [Tulosesus angulatus]
MPVPAQSVGNPHVSASRQRLVVRMREVEEDLQNLKRSYNALSATNSIPPEILSNIFIIHNASIIQTYPATTFQREAFSWIYVAHVCHHWREVALNCGALWSNLLFLKPSLTETMLTRSKNSPLTVKLLGHNNPIFEPSLSKILSQTHRLRSVNLSGNVKDTLLSNASGSAPLLEELTLAAFGNLSSKIPMAFLQGGAPSLKAINLKGIEIPFWGSLPLGPNLTHLRLDLKGLQHAHRPSASAFMKSLEELPLLQLLSLSGSLPIDTYPKWTSTSSPPIFRNLRDLFIDDTFSALSQFVQAEAIKIPKTATVAITLDYSFQNPEAIGRFLLELRERWEGLEAPIPGLAIFKTFEPGHLHDDDFGFNIYLDPSSDIFRRDRPDFIFNFSNTTDTLTCGEVFKAFVEELDLSHVQTLRISEGMSPLTANEWRMACTDLKALKTIIFETSDVSDFLGQLGKVPTNIDSTIPVTAPFPSLSKLVFHCLNFLQYFPTGSHFTSALIPALKRQQEASPLSVKLEILACNGFNHTQHKKVCESLPNLAFLWDNYEDNCDDDDDDDEGEGEWEDEDDGDSDIEDDSEEEDEA